MHLFIDNSNSFHRVLQIKALDLYGFDCEILHSVPWNAVKSECRHGVRCRAFCQTIQLIMISQGDCTCSTLFFHLMSSFDEWHVVELSAYWRGVLTLSNRELTVYSHSPWKWSLQFLSWSCWLVLSTHCSLWSIQNGGQRQRWVKSAHGLVTSWGLQEPGGGFWSDNH